MKPKWHVVMLTDCGLKHAATVKAETAREAAKIAGRKISYTAPGSNVTYIRVKRIEC